jgi:hypothetical protein
MTIELLSRVTRGFDCPHGPYGVKNDQRTAVTGDAWIRQPTRPPRDSEMTNELPSRVTCGFDSAHKLYCVINYQRTDVTGDAWIRRHRQPLGSQKSSPSCCY